MAAVDVQLSSAAGLLSLLDEPDPTLQVHALNQLRVVVDQFWAEIAPAIPKIEILYEDEQFMERSLAALVASKVFYHLDQLDEALKYALGASNLFDLSESSEFVETLISKCVDEYISVRQLLEDGKPDEIASLKLDPRLEDIVERMFVRCERDGEYRQELGIALESRRLDVVRRSITQTPNIKQMLSYAFSLTQKVIASKSFRRKVLEVLVELYRELETPDYIQMCQCLLFLDQDKSVADILHTLVEKGGDSALIAYQVAFDLSENQNQPFLNRVISHLPTTTPATASATATDAGATAPAATTPSTASVSAAGTTATSAMETESTPLINSSSSSASTPSDDSYESRLNRLKEILSGELPVNLYLNFLFQHNATDLNILKHIKEKLEQRNSVTHNATVIAHGFMHAGTTVDVFLRDNLEWLSKATNWAKFTATASIGVIHKGHHKEALKLLEPYLPSAGAAPAAAPGMSSGSPYAEGGALYALGLIHSSQGSDKLQYLLDALRNAGNNEIVQHGACLGIGLCAMASQREDIFEVLKSIAMSESAVAGEAAGYAMGLVYLGSNNGVAIEEMLAYAHETQHEKIIRGLALGIALIVYGQEESADIVIEQLVTDKDSILRYGGMHAIALAYVATANNQAISRLLHIGVTDVQDDVRRAAVTALGFVLCNVPDQVPRVVSLLAESYNPHVRYGSCMAVGAACAGGGRVGLKEALQLLEPLLRDRVDFVRQSAFIAMSMVLIQHNEQSEPKLAAFRKSIMDTMNVKADTMTKLGAILAAGIIDAGGRNCTIALLSQSGHRRMAAIVGLVLFNQFWYWYPMAHFLSLSFAPTAVIGLNSNLAIPAPFTFVSKAPPSRFATPQPFVVKVEEKKKEVKHATLSVTAKAKAKKAHASNASMDIDAQDKDKSESSVPPTPTAAGAGDKKDSDESKKEEKKDEAEALKPEPKYLVLNNPARVTWEQQSVLTFSKNQRYVPIKEHLGGIVMLRDTRPEEAENIVTSKQPKVSVPGVSDEEPAPPAPFEYTGN